MDVDQIASYRHSNKHENDRLILVEFKASIGKHRRVPARIYWIWSYTAIVWQHKRLIVLQPPPRYLFMEVPAAERSFPIDPIITTPIC
jgi:hypothetical protein